MKIVKQDAPLSPTLQSQSCGRNALGSALHRDALFSGATAAENDFVSKLLISIPGDAYRFFFRGSIFFYLFSLQGVRWYVNSEFHTVGIFRAKEVWRHGGGGQDHGQRLIHCTSAPAEPQALVVQTRSTLARETRG